MARLYSLPMRFILMYAIFASALFPWGLRGHRIVARIAENHLTDQAKQKVKELLGEETLTKVANEADSYRSDSKWKCGAPLHYVSIEDKETYLKAEKSPKGDIVRALFYFEALLRDKTAKPAMQTSALKWMVHLVGDIHQPLHVGRSCDRGGNSVQVTWFKSKTNLHKVWDSQFINHEDMSFSEYAESIDKAEPKTIATLQDSTYLSWAAESQSVRTQVYTCLGKDGCCANKSGNGQCKISATPFGSCDEKTSDFRANLEFAYIEKNREVLNRQLLKAGIRLAGTLNRVFAGAPLTTAEKSALEEMEALKTEEPNPVQNCVEQAVK